MNLQCAAANERRATAELIALLMQVDLRRLYLAEGCSSLFTYCRQVLHLSEHAAYARIEAARASQRFPIILDGLVAGTISLTAIGLLASHLTQDNHVEVLEAARHRSKREIEQLVARLNPKPDAPPIVRKLPESANARSDTVLSSTSHRPGSPVSGAPSSPAPAPEVKPLAPERYKIQFTVGRETYEELCHVQSLLRHSIPNGDPAAIFERALKLLLADLLRRKVAATDRPRESRGQQPTSRHISTAVKRRVWRRDGGRCAFKGTQGRCTETGFLEFHHVIPFAEGGKTTTNNLALRYRAHNAHEAERWFGPRHPPLLRERRAIYSVNLRSAGAVSMDDPHTIVEWRRRTDAPLRASVYAHRVAMRA